MNSAAAKYIRRIRNPHKQQYAKDYAAHLLGRGPQPSDAGISMMAAQGVRLQLAEYLR